MPVSKEVGEFSPEFLLKGLKTRILGSRIFLFKEIPSTQDEAKRRVEEGAPEGTTIISLSQKEGRGKRGNQWFSPPGGLYMSLILRPTFPLTLVSPITLTIAVAVVRAIREATGIQVRTKWPNDLMVRGKKVGGILTELCTQPRGIKHLVVGIGVNVNQSKEAFPSHLRDKSTSLKEESKKDYSLPVLIRPILAYVEKYYLLLQKEGFSPIMEEWRRISCTLGRWVKVISRNRVFEGQAIGIDAGGELIIRFDSGIQHQFVEGCVEILR